MPENALMIFLYDVITKLAFPKTWSNPSRLMHDQLFRLSGFVAVDIEISNGIRVCDNHGLPSDLALSISSSVSK